MKTFTILILSLIVSYTLNAQNNITDYLPTKDGKITYSGIVEVDSTSKVELYKRAKRWLAINYDDVVIDDFNHNELIARGYVYPTVWHTVHIQFKEGRYKYEFTNFRRKYFSVTSGSGSQENSPFEKHWVLGKRKGEYYENINSKIDEFINSFIQTLQKTDDNEW